LNESVAAPVPIDVDAGVTGAVAATQPLSAEVTVPEGHEVKYTASVAAAEASARTLTFTAE